MDDDKLRKISGMDFLDNLNSLQNKIQKATSFNDMAVMLSQVSKKAEIFDYAKQFGSRDFNRIANFANIGGAAFQLNDIARQMQLQNNTMKSLMGGSPMAAIAKHMEWTDKFERQASVMKSFKNIGGLSSIQELAQSIKQNQGLFNAQKSLALSWSESYLTRFGHDKTGLSSLFNNGFLQKSAEFKSFDILSGNTFAWLKKYEEENSIDLEEEITDFKQQLQQDREFKGKIIQGIAAMQQELKDLSKKVDEMEAGQIDDLDGMWVKLINKYITEPLGLPKWAAAIVLFVVMLIISKCSQEEPKQINQNFNYFINSPDRNTKSEFETFYDITISKTPVFLRKNEKTRKIATLENETEVEVLMEKGDWCYVQFTKIVKTKKHKEVLTKEMKGWIKRNYLDSSSRNINK